ncbi:MAG: hypothetical protein KF767_10675 [Bdellovibrionaceae bacterium]|nr:hypothetical protein [Pseudobdellovibrionaceae bacterium]
MDLFKTTLSAAMIFVSLSAFANDLPVPPPTAHAKPAKLTPEQYAELMALKINAGANVKVKSYDAKSKTFDIMIKNEPAVGPNTTSFENLRRAMGEPTAARRMGNPGDWVGREMTLVQDLILLPDAPAVPDKPVAKPATRPGKSR